MGIQPTYPSKKNRIKDTEYTHPAIQSIPHYQLTISSIISFLEKPLFNFAGDHLHQAPQTV